MISQKATVYSALKNDTILSNLVSGKIYMYLNIETFDGSPTVIYTQINNQGLYSFGNTENGQYISFQISIYNSISNSNTDIEIAVDDVMRSIGFQRESMAEITESTRRKSAMVYNKYM